MKNIVIFASGTGSNAARIIEFFADNPKVKVAAIFCNNPNAGVLEIATENQIPTEIFNKAEFSTEGFLSRLQLYSPDLIVLAGFLLMIPKSLIEAYPNKIVNIHPALLPKYGGKGMYGMNVHRAVRENNDVETGITIHYVDEHYDNGDIIAQFKTSINPVDSCDDIAEKVRMLEHKNFPKVVADLINKQ